MTFAGTRRASLAAGLTAAAGPIRIARGEGATVTPTTEGISPTEKMQRVLKAWELSKELHYEYPVPAATSETLTEAERVLGYHLPESMRTLYLTHNGGGFLGGNVNHWPLFPFDENPLAITTGTAQLREWNWDLPPELLVIGDDGSDGTYGLWIDDPLSLEPIVLEVDGTGGAFAVVGDDLASFLVGRSAFYLLGYASNGLDLTATLDTLEVPSELRRMDLGDEQYHAVFRWANPNLPEIDPDSYDMWWTPEQMREYVTNRGRGNP